jgi:hypothetical protein
MTKTKTTTVDEDDDEGDEQDNDKDEEDDTDDEDKTTPPSPPPPPTTTKTTPPPPPPPPPPTDPHPRQSCTTNLQGQALVDDAHDHVEVPSLGRVVQRRVVVLVRHANQPEGLA